MVYILMKVPNAYKELFEHAKMRGLTDVILFVTDGFKGLELACKEIFPKARFQRCWVHIMRAIRMIVRKSD